MKSLNGIPVNLSKELNTIKDLKIMRLSNIFYSSLRAVKNVYLKATKTFWTPEELEITSNGTMIIDGYKLSFYQVEPDIRGGKGVDYAGNKYFMKGGNQLERLRLIPIIDLFGRKIAVLVMDFKNEEHPLPTIDTIYRGFRRIAFKRIRDIEAIALEFTKDGLKIAIRGICSENKTFASRVGAHKTCIIETTKTDNSIYVSNVWNHAMATWNTNPNLNIIKVAPKLVLGLFKEKTIQPENLLVY